MNNFQQPGITVPLTAPAGGVVSGTAYKIGQLLVVAQASAAAGATFQGLTKGVVRDMPKLSAQAWAEGDLVYWDDGASEFTTVATGNLLAGCALEVAVNPSATGVVRLNGIASVDSA